MKYLNGYSYMFGANLLAAAINFGLGGINVVFGLISLGMSLFMWKLWYNGEKEKHHVHKT